MEINIKPEEIDSYVKNAIIESSIGKILKESSKKFLDDICKQHYDSPVKHMIHNIVREMLKEELNKPETLALIKEVFISKINEQTIRDVVYKMMDKISPHGEDIR